MPEISDDEMDELVEPQAKVLDYEQAIETTMDKNRPFFGKWFQILIIFVVLMSINANNFLILGLPFMKIEPKHFTCKNRETQQWEQCDKAYICANNLDKSEYEPDKDDYMYIDNWSGQCNLLCESKERIGGLGACYFIGILIGTTILPLGYLSDQIGRKPMFLLTLVIQILSEIGFIYARSLDQLYISMILLGVTFPGTMIVGQAFAYEFCTDPIKAHF